MPTNKRDPELEAILKAPAAKPDLEASPEPVAVEVELDVLEHDPDGCDECLAQEAAEEEKLRMLEDDVEAESLEAPEAEPEKRYHRWQKCKVCRRYVSWDAPGEHCDQGCGERITPDEALVLLEPLFEIWTDDHAITDRLYPPVYEAELKVDARDFRTFLGQIGALADECRLVLEDDGLHVKVVDPAHVAMIDVVFPKAHLWSYVRPKVVPEAGTELFFGVDVTRFLEALGKRKDAMYVAFRFGPGAMAERAVVRQEGYVRDVALVDTSGMSDPKVPLLNMTASFETPVETLIQVVKDAASISDHIRITVATDGVEFLAEGDVDKMRATFPFGQDGVVRGPTGNERASSLYPLDYLTTIVKALKAKDAFATVSLGTDYPLKIEWDGPVTKGTYLLAPRIESP